jgi:hypothetical protein
LRVCDILVWKRQKDQKNIMAEAYAHLKDFDWSLRVRAPLPTLPTFYFSLTLLCFSWCCHQIKLVDYESQF